MPWDTEEVLGPTLKAFEAHYPNVSVQASYVPPVAQYISTLEERLLAGTAADVFIYTDEDEAALNAHHFVRDLSDQPWVKYVARGNREFASTRGRLWGLSVTTWTAGPIYNVDLLHKAGYNAPPATWADFLKLCSTLKDMKVTPIYDGGPPPPGAILVALIGGYYSRHYGKNIDPEIFAGKISFVDAWTEPLTAYAELYTQGLVSTAWLGLTGYRDRRPDGRGQARDVCVRTVGRGNHSGRQSLPQNADGTGPWPGSRTGVLVRVTERSMGDQREGQKPSGGLRVLGLPRQPSRTGTVHRQAGLPLRHVQLYPQTAELFVPSCSACPEQLVLLLRHILGQCRASDRATTRDPARGRSREHDRGEANGQGRPQGSGLAASQVA